jgi:hypothetical protein
MAHDSPATLAVVLHEPALSPSERWTEAALRLEAAARLCRHAADGDGTIPDRDIFSGVEALISQSHLYTARLRRGDPGDDVF